MGKKKKGLSPKEKAELIFQPTPPTREETAKLIGSVAALLTALFLWR